MASLRLDKVVKEFGSARIIHGVNLDINHGEFVVFVGPSGCGKSTLLRMIAGLDVIETVACWATGTKARDSFAQGSK